MVSTRFIRFTATLLAMILITGTLRGQVSASVSLSRTSVYTGQPFRVTITVWTRTWFTAPLQFGNMQIPGSFMVPFDDPQPGMFAIGKTQYPGIQFYYIVIPYQTGEFTVPPLEITAQSPPEGSSTGRKVVIHTGEHKFTVRDVPSGLKGSAAWLVAKHVTLTERWSPAPENLKTGDVLKRTLTITASGTLPQFIPDLSPQEKVDWASTYPDPAVLHDTKEGGDVEGRSVQTITYLLEKAGEFTLPAIELSYWNPVTARAGRATVKAREFTVAENPDLGILTTLRDSLDAANKPVANPDARKKPVTIFGLRPWQAAGLVATTVVAGWLLFLSGRFVIRKIRAAWRRYLAGDRHLFRRFILSGDTPGEVLPALYRWWDNRPRRSASIAVSFETEGEKEASRSLKTYLESIYTSPAKPESASEIKKLLKKIRPRQKRKRG